MVYEPAEDTFLMENAVKKYAKGDVLEIGTGSGYLANIASKQSNIIATDIDPKAIQQAKEKYAHIKFLKSDLFQKVKGKYDVIFFNPPYLPLDKREPEDSRLQTTGGKHGYETIQRFIEQANDYLRSNGLILLLFSNHTNKEKVEKIIVSHLFKWDKESFLNLEFETLYVYKLEKSKILKNLSHLKQIKPLAKGKRGLTFTAKSLFRKVVIKIQNPKAEVNRLEIEADFLKLINKYGLGPKLYYSEKDYLIERFIPGITIKQYLEEHNREEILEVFRKSMRICRELDRLNITKEEMHKPVKHILIHKNKVKFIDFERCHFTKKPSNVTQFADFILSINRAKNLKLDPIKIIKASHDYKKTFKEKEYSVILNLIK